MKQSVFGEYEGFTMVEVDLTRTHLGINTLTEIKSKEYTANKIEPILARFRPKQKKNRDPKFTT
jgi:hypothetical protein